MKLSLKFFYTKIAHEYPETYLSVLPRQIPSFSASGLVTESMEASEDVIYIDALPKRVSTFPTHTSVITTSSRANLFQQCNLIILPDSINLIELVQMVSSIFTHYFNWADAVYEAIAKNMDLQAIIDITAPVLKNPIYLTDSSFKMLASWGEEYAEVNPTWRYQRKYGYLPYQAMQNLAESGELKKLYNTPHAWKVSNSKGFSSLPFISKSIRKDGVHYGNFYIIEYNKPLDACDIEIADYLGKVLSNALQGSLNYLESSSLYHVHFLEDIIEGTLTDKQIMVDQLRALHWKMEDDYIVALFDTSGTNEAILLHMMEFLANDLGAQSLNYHGNVLAIINDLTENWGKIHAHLKQLARNAQRSVALSEQFSDFSQVRLYYQQAKFALDIHSQFKNQGRLFHYRYVYYEHLALMMKDKIAPFAPALTLRDYDRKHATEYCKTILSWLNHERGSAEAATELFIHRNTMKNRLDKVEELLKIDFNDPWIRDRMRITLSTLNLEEAVIAEE